MFYLLLLLSLISISIIIYIIKYININKINNNKLTISPIQYIGNNHPYKIYYIIIKN
jgi:hypothetical protein